MTEPDPPRMRPTIVRLLVIVCVLVLSACGNSAGGQSGSSEVSAGSSSANPQTIGGCATGDVALRAATELGVADLGLGEAPVALTGADGNCPDLIFTRAPDGTAYLALDYRPTAARVISVGDVQLVAVREMHPRGGFQEHLYGARGAELAEVTRDGNPLLPFVALDAAGQPHASADCDGTRLRVLEPEPTQPSGVLMAWDVFAASYTFADGEVVSRPRSRIAHSVPDTSIEKAHPALFEDAWFRSCS